MPKYLFYFFITALVFLSKPALAETHGVSVDFSLEHKSQQRWWPSPDVERDYMLPANLETLDESHFPYRDDTMQPRYRIWVRPILADQEYSKLSWTMVNNGDDVLKQIRIVAFVDGDAEHEKRIPLILGSQKQLSSGETWSGSLELPIVNMNMDIYWFALVNDDGQLQHIQFLKNISQAESQEEAELSAAKAASAWSLVTLYQQAQKPDMAKEKAWEILSQYPGSPEAALARELLGESPTDPVHQAKRISADNDVQVAETQVVLMPDLQDLILDLPIADLAYDSLSLGDDIQMTYYGRDGLIHDGVIAYEPSVEDATKIAAMRESLAEAARVAKVLRRYPVLEQEAYELYLNAIRSKDLAIVASEIESLKSLLAEGFKDLPVTERENARLQVLEERNELRRIRLWLERASLEQIAEAIEKNKESDRRAVAKAKQQFANEQHLQKIAGSSDAAAQMFASGLKQGGFITGFRFDSKGGGSLNAEVIYNVDFSYQARNGVILTRRGFIGTARHGNRWTVVAFNAWGEQQQISDTGFQNIISGRARSF